MPIEPIFEKINVNNRKKYLSETIWCQAKTNVSCSDIKEILSITAQAGVFGSETSNGQITFNGKTVFCVCFLDNQGQVRKAEATSDFNGLVKNENVKEGFKAVITPETKKTEFDLSGVTLSLSASVVAVIETVESCELNALVGGEGLVCDNQEIQVVKSYGVKESVYPIEEEFELGYEIKEVLSHRASAVITATQCGVGAIIVDGKVFLTLIALQNQEKCVIIKETRTIPFRMEIECEDAMPTMRATAKVYEKALKTKIEVDQEKQTSLVSVSLNLYFTGEVFLDQTVTVCKDAFSVQENLNIVSEESVCEKLLEPIFCSVKVNGKAPTEELPIGVRLNAIGNEKAEIISAEQTANGLKISGALSSILYFTNGDGEAFTRKVEMPFIKDCDLILPEENLKIELIIKADNGTARLVSATEVEIECELNFTVYGRETAKINVIKEINSLGEKVANPHAISVFIPTENEELWSLSKRLNVCPETLILTNPELTFPLTGKERIVVYRQR